ncbi:hypothetical protein IAR50_006790 [Cryptococcus sp. DSM 104548]
MVSPTSIVALMGKMIAKVSSGQVKNAPPRLAVYRCNPLMWGAEDFLKDLSTSTGNPPKALIMSRTCIENEDAFGIVPFSIFLEAHVDIFTPHLDGSGEQIKYFLSVVRERVDAYIDKRNGCRGTSRNKLDKEIRKADAFIQTVIEDVVGASSGEFVYMQASRKDEDTTPPVFKKPSPYVARSVAEDSMLSVDEVKAFLHSPSRELYI